MVTKTRFPFYIFFIISFFTGCYGCTSNKAKTDFDTFPIEKKTDETELLKIDQLHPDAIDLYNDSVLCFINGNGENGYHFALYHLSEKSFLHPQLEMGRKQGQALGFHSYGFERNNLWVHDVNKGKIIFSRMDSLRDTSNNHFIRDISLPGYYYSAQLLNDTTILASGNYIANDNYKLSIISHADGRITKQLVPYSSDSSVPYNRAQKTAYECFLFVKPTKNQCVLAYRYADKVEIVDLNTEKSKVIHGPEGFEPEMKVVAEPDGNKISIRGPNTRNAFVRGKVTNKFIYLLYSGNKDGTSHHFYGHYIYVYNWEAKPIQRLELENDVQDFAVTSNDSLLYTYNPASKYISVAKLSN